MDVYLFFSLSEFNINKEKIYSILQDLTINQKKICILQPLEKYFTSFQIATFLNLCKTLKIKWQSLAKTSLNEFMLWRESSPHQFHLDPIGDL